MHVAHEKLHGLDRDRLLAVVEPVLRAHGVEAVELVWRTERGEWVLELTVERPDSRIPGAGITLDLCSDISRQLSAALDGIEELIPGHYRLEVGSPGLDRALYAPRDYARFAGQNAKLKLREPVDGQRVLLGTLHGLDDDGRIVIETERGEILVDFATIEHGRLVFDWSAPAPRSGKPRGAGRQARGRGAKARRSQRNTSQGNR